MASPPRRVLVPPLCFFCPLPRFVGSSRPSFPRFGLGALCRAESRQRHKTRTLAASGVGRLLLRPFTKVSLEKSLFVVWCERSAAAVSPSPLRFSRHSPLSRCRRAPASHCRRSPLTHSVATLAPLRQVPQGAPRTMRALRTAVLGLPTAHSPWRQGADDAEKEKHLALS